MNKKKKYKDKGGDLTQSYDKSSWLNVYSLDCLQSGGKVQNQRFK